MARARAYALDDRPSRFRLRRRGITPNLPGSISRTRPMTDTAIDGDIKPATVASYLRRHPDFLTACPDVSNELVLPSVNGPAAALSVHQLRGLREKNAELEVRLKELTG